MVLDPRLCDVVLEAGDIHSEGGFKGSVVLTDHSFVGKPGDGVSYDVVVFEGGFEFFYEVFEGTHGDGGSGNGLLSEGGGPGLGCFLGHVREGEGDFLGVGVVASIIDF